jgi:aspartate 1-decarboxylase
MYVHVLKSKIHRLRVTQADLNYIGSISIDPDLLEAANMIDGEKVTVLNINNGERLETYIIEGDRGSGEITMNGPAALKVSVGDLIIVIAYAMMEEEEAKKYKPAIVFPNAKTNKLD